jgi:hypothetical protein
MPLSAVVDTELLRSVVAPFGHGLWTAILGGVLFREARGGRLRVDSTVLLTYLWVSLLHALWDYTHSIALTLTLLITGTPWQYQLLRRGYLPQPSPEQIHVFTALSIGLLVVVALLGVATLRATWRRTASKEFKVAGLP